MDLIQKLITYGKKIKWQLKAQEFIDVLKSHHCSSFFKTPVPTDFVNYHNLIKNPRDITLVEIKLCHDEYPTLRDFIQDLYLVFSNFKEFYGNKSFFYKQAESMENFMTHLIKEENIFDMFSNDIVNKIVKDKIIEKPDDDDIQVIID